MKILFSTRPSFGHVYPLMPLAAAARDAGHDVRFATTGMFLPKLRALGYRTEDVGITIERASDVIRSLLTADEMPKGGDGRPDLEVGGRMFIDLVARRTAADLAPVLDRADVDLVVYENFDVGAAVAAHASGRPAVCHSLSPRMPQAAIDLTSGDRLERLWAEHGVTSPTLDVFTGDAYLDIFPTVLQEPSFRADPARVALRPMPFAEPGASVPAWVGRTDRPLIYLTLGTVVATDDVLTPVIHGLASLDADVLVALGSADGTSLGTLPPNVRIEAFVDQPGVLAHAALAVHHGGSGTILGALTAGVPQLLLPKGADQFFNTDAMAAAGLAPVLAPAQVTASAITALAGDSIGRPNATADAVRAELAAMPDPHDVIERLAARFGPGTIPAGENGDGPSDVAA
ncbi:MAG: glycosyltransferase [Ilumatobacteraceae bacterium]